MRIDVLVELMAAAPTSIAPGLTVETAGTVKLETAAAELAMLEGASRGVDVFTPE